MKKKLMAVALATIIAVMAVAGASLAWLKDTTGPVTNTFTEGKVDIDLFEHTYDPSTNTLTATETRTGVSNYKMVPGDVLPKDPTVVVIEGSEPCYVFVKVEASENVETFLEYSVDSKNWTPLNGYAGIYFKKIDAYTVADTSFNVLTDNQVKVKTTVTMQNMIDNTSDPTLTFTAYAIQSAHFENEVKAWEEILTPTDTNN